MSEITKGEIIELLQEWIKQRPGLEYCNYGDRTSYFSEMRSITKDRHDAEKLLQAVDYSNITVEELKAAFSAFSGRLQLKETPKGWRLEYCTGQYWPTEYRKAVCAVLASALWAYHRPDYDNVDRPGDAMRKMFRQRFGRLANRWLD